MNWAKKAGIDLLYLKILVLGDKELEQKGKRLPCKTCGEMFMSFPSYGEFGLECDTRCRKCLRN